jgi:nitrite reductase/ring-hydroxylating ferredoxin subunit
MSKHYQYNLANYIRKENFGGIFLESGYVRVADKSEIPIGKTKKVAAQGKEILVANVNGSFFAIGNICTHSDGHLSQGTLEGNIITCPKHKARWKGTLSLVQSTRHVGREHYHLSKAQGTLEGNIITCPKHKSKFDVTTGKVVSPPKMGLFRPKIQDEQTYVVKTENDDILIKI